MIKIGPDKERVRLDGSIEGASKTRTETRCALEEVELFPGRRAFGALPHYEKLDKHQEELSADIQYFSEGEEPLNEGERRALLLHRLKFGNSLISLADTILSNYPYNDREGDRGKIVSIFGLSGSGKSLALEGLQERYKNVVPIDFDTALINLFGPKIRSVEESNGSKLKEIREHLVHNEIKGCYLLLVKFLVKKLRKRGYIVAQTAITPHEESDHSFYIEHDEIDPLDINEDDRFALERAVKILTERTTGRIDGADDFDWSRKKIETRFADMPRVTVKVPREVHAIFLSTIRRLLSENLTVRKIKNPFQNDREKAKVELAKQIEI